ncbi:MAG TPA: DUF2071 domain-containing protein [Propionibacteriaceae bacterium]|nr:DUF2071 domain-containing protein [Propionibacteriaceae bacterium]
MTPDRSGWAEPQPVRRTAAPLGGRVLLDQHWRDLTFVHWRVDSEQVAPLLPVGTRPDVHDGSSWVGLVPFRLTGAALGTGPPLPYVGSFPETNVRLYSVDAAGRRGVVFCSLEAARLPFVLGARVALGLNYTWARMRIRRHGDVITYTSRRRWPGPAGAHNRLVARVGAEVVSDEPLANFLTARWGLHTRRLGRTLYLPNTHDSWPLLRAEVLELDDDLLEVAGFPGVAARAPDSVLFSPGVRTQFGAPAWRRPTGG